ncbi:MAG: hypothetical protein SNF33_05500 [Candidatus Algichlamydia australiensis]|nr:hypothetical protein [Chlamydiales bacterium]
MIRNKHFTHPLVVEETGGKKTVQIAPLQDSEISSKALWAVTYDVGLQRFKITSHFHKRTLSWSSERGLRISRRGSIDWQIKKTEDGYYTLFVDEKRHIRSTDEKSVKYAEGGMTSTEWDIQPVDSDSCVIVNKKYGHYLYASGNENIKVKEQRIPRKYLWESISVENGFLFRNLNHFNMVLEIVHTNDVATKEVGVYEHPHSNPHASWRLVKNEDGTFSIVSNTRFIQGDAYLEVPHNRDLNPFIENKPYLLSWYKHSSPVPDHATWSLEKIGPSAGLHTDISMRRVTGTSIILAYPGIIHWDQEEKKRIAAIKNRDYLSGVNITVRGVVNRVPKINDDGEAPPNRGMHLHLSDEVTQLEIQVKQLKLHLQSLMTSVQSMNAQAQAKTTVLTEISAQKKVNELDVRIQSYMRDLPRIVQTEITEGITEGVKNSLLGNSDLVNAVATSATEKVMAQILPAISQIQLDLNQKIDALQAEVDSLKN